MAGNSRSGRRPDPTKAKAPKAVGEPVRPDFTDPEAAAFWDVVVPGLVKAGIVGELDSAALQTMCEMWGLYPTRPHSRSGLPASALPPRTGPGC